MNTQNPSSAGAGADRRSARQSMFLQAALMLPDGGKIIARVRNISATGMLADCDRPVKIGLDIVTELRGIGKVHGHTVWTSGNRAGIAFDGPVDPQLALKPSGAAKADETLPYYLRTLNQGGTARKR